MEAGDVKAAYLLREQVEVLNEKGVTFYNIDGKEGKLLREVEYICKVGSRPEKSQEDDDLILDYKGNKVAVFTKVEVWYDHIEKISPSFYQIEKDGKKGFLDKHTLEVYFFKQ